MIDGIAEKIKKMESRKAEFGKQVRENSSSLVQDSDFFLEDEIISQVSREKLDGIEIIGIDGGIVKEELVGADVVLTRAVAACFNFEDGKLSSSKYVPNRNPDPEPHVYEGLDRREFRVISSLLRVKKEAELVLNVLKRDPEVVLMDGSIVPHNSDKPSKGSQAYEVYKEVLEIYEKIYSEAHKRGVLLAGIVEDSRDRKVCNSLKNCVDSEKYQELFSKTRDLDLIEKFLEKGERTSVMRYSKEEENHPILSDLDFKGNARTFYMRTAENDLPVKIDFLYGEKSEVNISALANQIAEKVLPISTFNRNYGIPSVIIEADQRAKLGKKHISSLKRDLRSQVGDSSIFKDLRRNRRPF